MAFAQNKYLEKQKPIENLSLGRLFQNVTLK